MNKNKSEKSLFIIILLVFNLCVSGFMAAYLFLPGTQSGGQIGFSEAKNGKYTLYIGANDKDTYEQIIGYCSLRTVTIIDTDTAIDIVNNICAENLCGYTMMEARGGRVTNGELFHENHWKRRIPISHLL